MSELELNVLGDLEVLRDGAPLQLPPSKKTRALLAYLALNDRGFRREHLCELLWEIPDDPRGSLRWSLSKLRRVVDGDGQARIVADRNNVRLDTTGMTIDVRELRRVAEGNLADAEVAGLEELVCRYRGNFLEGLELANFHDFHAWCVAEREAAARARIRLLEHLVERLTDDPERALPHARALVGAAPYDEGARARLIRLLVATHRDEEADQQVQLGSRLLEEAGIAPTGGLAAARRSRRRHEVSRPAVVPAVDEKDLLPMAAVRPESAELFGRESECGQLRTVLGQVMGRPGLCCVLLRGEPGIGKSRLLEWVRGLAEAMDAQVLQAAGFESEAMRPYALWIDALRGRGDDQRVFGDGDRDNRDRLFAGLSDYLLAAADRGPVVVLFDDVQWADESSLAALRYVARMCRQVPLLLVLAGRDAEMQDSGHMQQAIRGLRQDGLLEEVPVGPLSERAIRDLLEARGANVDAAALSVECSGSPLLAIELSRARAGGDGSGSLDDLVAERLSRFDLDNAEVLRWAAVLSPRIDLPTLTRLSGQDENQVGAALERGERQAMLRPTDAGLRFTHDLIARGVYAQIAPARRRVMHRRVAELIEAEATQDLEHAADLAHHALASGDPGLGARALVSAGKLCLRFFANDHALVLARRGLQLATQLAGAEQVCRRIELFDVMLTAAPVYDWEAAAEEYASLAEQALDHGELAHARLGYHMSSTVRWAHGHWVGAREESLQAELITRGASEQEHVVGMAETAKCLAMLERDLNQADAMLMEAKAVASRARITYPSLPAAEALLCYHRDELDSAAALLREARTLYKSAGDRLNEFQANEYLVMVDMERGDYASARQKAEALVQLGERIREGSEAPFARALLGLTGYVTGAAHDNLAAALDELRLLDAKHRLAYVLNRMAEQDLACGRGADAERHAAEALDCASALERTSEMLIAHGTLHGLARAAGDAAAVAGHRSAIDTLSAGQVAPWAVARGRRHIEEGT